MKFAQPGWLWFLLLVPVLGAALEWQAVRARRRLEAFARESMWGRLMPERDPLLLRIRRILLLMAFGFVFVALARPQWGVIEETQKLTGLDIVVVLDVSNSMNVEDVVPNRLQKAKHFLRRMFDGLGGDRVGLVAFAGSSYLAAPLTTDIDYVREVLEDLGPRSITNQGTSLSIALETAAASLRRAAEAAAEDPSTQRTSGQSGSAPSSRVVVLVSDGEEHVGDAKQGAGALRVVGAQLLVLGVGTEAGGPVPIRDERGQLFGYKRGENGQPVVSRFTEAPLRDAAREIGGQYWTMTPDERELDQVMATLRAVTRGENGERRVTTLEERFYIPLWLAFACLMLELVVPARRRRAMPTSGAAAKALAVVFLLLGIFPAPARAEARTSSLDAFLENRRGLKASQEGKWEEALRRFGKAQADNPDLPELQFNQGTAHLGREEYDRSMQVLDEAARKAREGGNHRLSAQALFNSAVGAEKGQKMADAATRYMQALDEARTAGDSALESDIRKNLELLVRKNEQQKQQQKQQQQQQQNQDQQKKDQDGQGDPQQGKQSQDSKDDKGSDQKQQEPRQYQSTTDEQRRRSFQSSKLSESDAEQVMSELSDKERELRARLGRKKTQGQDASMKDW